MNSRRLSTDTKVSPNAEEKRAVARAPVVWLMWLLGAWYQLAAVSVPNTKNPSSVRA